MAKLLELDSFLYLKDTEQDLLVNKYNLCRYPSVFSVDFDAFNVRHTYSNLLLNPNSIRAANIEQRQKYSSDYLINKYATGQKIAYPNKDEIYYLDMMSDYSLNGSSSLSKSGLNFGFSTVNQFIVNFYNGYISVYEPFSLEEVYKFDTLTLGGSLLNTTKMLNVNDVPLLVVVGSDNKVKVFDCNSFSLTNSYSLSEDLALTLSYFNHSPLAVNDKLLFITFDYNFKVKLLLLENNEITELTGLDLDLVDFIADKFVDNIVDVYYDGNLLHLLVHQNPLTSNKIATGFRHVVLSVDFDNLSVSLVKNETVNYSIAFGAMPFLGNNDFYVLSFDGIHYLRFAGEKVLVNKVVDGTFTDFGIDSLDNMFVSNSTGRIDAILKVVPENFLDLRYDVDNKKLKVAVFDLDGNFLAKKVVIKSLNNVFTFSGASQVEVDTSESGYVDVDVSVSGCCKPYVLGEVL